MLSYPSSSRFYLCPQCLTPITVAKVDQQLVVCPGCGNTTTVAAKYVSLVVSLAVLASYACSFLFVYWLTHDIRRFMLLVLECAFGLLALSARFLFPLLYRGSNSSAGPKRVSDSSGKHSWLGRAS